MGGKNLWQKIKKSPKKKLKNPGLQKKKKPAGQKNGAETPYQPLKKKRPCFKTNRFFFKLVKNPPAKKTGLKIKKKSFCKLKGKHLKTLGPKAKTPLKKTWQKKT